MVRVALHMVLQEEVAAADQRDPMAQERTVALVVREIGVVEVVEVGQMVVHRLSVSRQVVAVMGKTEVMVREEVAVESVELSRLLIP